MGARKKATRGIRFWVSCENGISPLTRLFFFFLSRGGEGEGQMLLCPRALSGKRRTKVVIKENLSAEGMSLLKGRSVGKMLAWVKIALQLNSLSFNSG